MLEGGAKSHLRFWRDELRRRRADLWARRLSAAQYSLAVRSLEKIGQPQEWDLEVDARQLGAEILSEDGEPGGALVRVPASLRAEENRWFGPKRVWRLRDVVLDVPSGLVFCEGRVLAQSGTGHRWSRDAAFITGAFRRLQEMAVLDVRQPITWLGAADNFYHLLIESRPRVIRSRQGCDSVVFAASGPLTEIQGRVLELVPRDLHIAGSPLLRCSELLLVPPEPMFWLHPRDLDLLASLTETPARSNRLLYVSRSRSSRQLPEEVLLESLLADAGFDVVHFELLSLEEQFRIASESRFISGPHGAGLANALFCRPGGVLVEIVDRTWWTPSFQRLAATRGLAYSYLDSNTPVIDLARQLIRAAQEVA